MKGTVLQIFSVSFALFLLMDSIGNVPIFISILKDISPRHQRRIIARELGIALVIILLFALLGDYLLEFLAISRASILVSGGVILVIIALRMIFPRKEGAGHLHDKEPFIVPLAIPLVAGPAVLAAVILYAGQLTRGILVSSVVIAWGVSTFILLSSSFLKKILGDRGLTACERLMGLILVWIAVQMFMDGISSYFHIHV